MKTWHLVAIAVVGVLLIRWFVRGRSGVEPTARPVVDTNRNGVPLATATVVTGIAQGQWPGAYGFDPKDVTAADQWLYPGWYRTPDGGWVRPETGEYFSPGSSPISTGLTLAAREEIDKNTAATNAGIAAGIAAAPTAYAGDWGEVIR